MGTAQAFGDPKNKGKVPKNSFALFTTEFEGCTVNYGPRFSCPGHKWKGKSKGP